MLNKKQPSAYSQKKYVIFLLSLSFLMAAFLNDYFVYSSHKKRVYIQASSMAESLIQHRPKLFVLDEKSFKNIIKSGSRDAFLLRNWPIMNKKIHDNPGVVIAPVSEIVQINNDRSIFKYISVPTPFRDHPAQIAYVSIPLDKIIRSTLDDTKEIRIFIFTLLFFFYATVIWLFFFLSGQKKTLAEKSAALRDLEMTKGKVMAALLDQKKKDKEISEIISYFHAVDECILICVTDIQGRIVHVNNFFCNRLGYRPEEIIGWRHDIMASGRHDDTYFKDMWTMIKRGHIWRDEICNKDKNGELCWLDMCIVPLRDDSGSIYRFVSISTEITEQKLKEDSMRHQSTHDALTGLPNRLLLQDRIRQVLESDRRYKRTSAVLFIDLDQFKIINDSLGHEYGDALLQNVAERLKTCIRAEDTVARQGGDEFIVLLPHVTSPDHAGVVASNLLKTLVKPYNIKGHELHISASIGIAVYPEDGSTMEELMKNSDIAMYYAKEFGRNNYQFFNKEMNAQAEKKHIMVSYLRKAMDLDQFFLEFQPIVDIKTSRIVGLEALLRWNHPERGLISPIEFVPIAEETGLMVNIGEWVIKNVCKTIAHWQNSGHESPRVAINLSSRQFFHKELIPVIEESLATNKLKGSCLRFEITEATLSNQAETVIDKMHSLKKMDIEIAIDDFGTGYSSINYLKQFPIDILKIDRSFVGEINHENRSDAIIKTIINIAHGMNMQVIAEGVEKQEQLTFLKKHKCDMYQGYFFSKAIKSEELVHGFF